MKSTMSQAALDRCRRLVIKDESTEDSYVRILEVLDPRLGGRVVASYRSRTLLDTERVRRAFMGQFRIPEELVSALPADNKDIAEDTEENHGTDEGRT